MLSRLKTLSDAVLVTELKDKVKIERKILYEILEMLFEVYSRKLYLDLPCCNLEEYCMKELGYSKGAAIRRVASMKLIYSLPEEKLEEVKGKIEDGSLNLTQLVTVQGFLKNEAKDSHRFYTADEMCGLLETVENKSKLETERELAKISPQSVPKQLEKVKYLSEKEVELTLVVDQEFLDIFNSLKALKSHSQLNGIQLLKEAMKDQITRVVPKPKTIKVQTPPSRKVIHNRPPVDKVEKSQKQSTVFGKQLSVTVNRQPMTVDRSRYIPMNVKRIAWARHNGECSHVNKETGEVCGSKYFLQFDHIHEFAKGGSSLDPNNIRLLCGAHNRHRNQEGNRI